jgi:hypothetical protein
LPAFVESLLAYFTAPAGVEVPRRGRPPWEAPWATMPSDCAHRISATLHLNQAATSGRNSFQIFLHFCKNLSLSQHDEIVFYKENHVDSNI